MSYKDGKWSREAAARRGRFASASAKTAIADPFTEEDVCSAKFDASSEAFQLDKMPEKAEIPESMPRVASRRGKI